MSYLLENRNKYGFSAEIRTSEIVGSRLSIRYCGYNSNEEEDVLRLLRQFPHQTSLKLASELVIKRCPWCGYSIKKMLAGIEKGLYWRALDKLRTYSD
jgi:hypothetical protein